MRVAFRLALSHHPLCSHFHSDRFGPFCSGCAFFWPSFAITTPLAVAAVLEGADSVAMFMGGAVLGAPQLLTLAWRFSRPVRAAVKLLGGVGVAVANVGLVMLPAPLEVKLSLLSAEMLAFAFVMALRMRSILAVCSACPWRRDWEHCPGFVPGAKAEPPRPAAVDARLLPPPVT